MTYPSLEQFTTRHGIDVTYREAINSNEEFFGKIQPQLAGGQIDRAGTSSSSRTAGSSTS